MHLVQAQNRDRLTGQDFDVCSLANLTEKPFSSKTLAGGQLLGVVLRIITELRLLSILCKQTSTTKL